MPRIIPSSIKEKVIQEYLRGITRDKIAQNNGIGEGTVSSIVQTMKSEIWDIDTLRIAATSISKQGYNLSGLASTLRLKKGLERLELPEEKVEVFLEEIFEHCYKNDIENKDFISKINEAVQFSKETGIPILSIPDFVREMKRKLNHLELQISTREQQIQKLYQSYGITHKNLEEYKRCLPMFENTIAAEDKARQKERENCELRQEILKLEEKIVARDRKIHDLQKETRYNSLK